MANAHIRFGGCMGGGAPVLSPMPRASATINTTSTSAATSITANSGDFVRVVASGGPVRIAIGPNPTAIAGAGDVVLDGMAVDLGPLSAGDKVAAIDAA